MLKPAMAWVDFMYGRENANEPSMEKIVTAIRKEAIEHCADVVVKACCVCGGQGFTVTTTSGHACDGTEESCQRNCPVPVQEQEQCEYCGRPQSAILSELAKLESNFIPKPNNRKTNTMAKRAKPTELGLKGTGVEDTTDKKLISLGDDYVNETDNKNAANKRLKELDAEIHNRMNVLGLSSYRVGDKLFRDDVKHKVKVATVKGRPEDASAPTEAGA